jgi:hypothetical protein
MPLVQVRPAVWSVGWFSPCGTGNKTGMKGWYDLSSTFQPHERAAQDQQERLRPHKGLAITSRLVPGDVQESVERVPLTEVQEARNGQYY